MRHGVAGVDQGVLLGIGVERGDPLGELSHRGPDGLGLGRQVDRAGAAHAGAGVIRDVDGGRPWIEQGPEGGGASQVEVGVVFVGEADPAVHLDVEVGAQIGGIGRGDGRHGGGDRQLVPTSGRRSGGIPDRGRGELGRHEHVGAMVFDGLEHGDRPTELDALLGVGRRLFGALACHTCRLGGEDHPVEVDEGLAGAGQDRRGGGVEREA